MTESKRQSSSNRIEVELLRATGQGVERAISTEEIRAIDRVCREFELRWTSDRIPIERLLSENPGLTEEALLESLLAVELELVWRTDEPPAVVDYQSRFSLHHKRVAEVFRKVRIEMATDVGQSTRDTSGETVDLHPSKTNSPPTIPGYQIVGELGRGGMGVVYRARQLRLNREVALKVIADSGSAMERRRERFRVEGEIVASFVHPNIAHVYDAGEANTDVAGGVCFLATELVEGGTLADVSKPIESRVAIQLIAVIAKALETAHAKGVIHRDLKPANILLAEVDQGGVRIEGRQLMPKVADFGLACWEGQNSGEEGTICGTPDFMAPEQVTEREKISFRTDIHALGVILYQLLTGTNPFRASSVLETVRRVEEYLPKPPSEYDASISSQIDRVCLKCLSKKPSARFQSATELVLALESILKPPAFSLPLRAALLVLLAVISIALFGVVNGSWFAAEKWFRAEKPTATEGPRTPSFSESNNLNELAISVFASERAWILARKNGREYHIETLEELEGNKKCVIGIRLPMKFDFDSRHADELLEFDSLLNLDVSHTLFDDGDAQVVEHLPNLEAVDLFATQVTGKSIESLQMAKNLRFLSIGQTRLTPRDLSQLSKLPLETMNVTGDLFDELDAALWLQKLTKLRALQVISCVPEQLEQIVQLRQLNELRLYPADLNVATLELIQRLPKLEVLDITVENGLEPRIDLSGLHELRQLQLRFVGSPTNLPQFRFPETMEVVHLNGDLGDKVASFVGSHPGVAIYHDWQLIVVEAEDGSETRLKSD